MILRLLAAIGVFVGGMVEAQACTCADRQSGGSSEQMMHDRLKKAELVVTGRVVQLRAGRDLGGLAFSSNTSAATSMGRAVRIIFAIDRAVKGQLSGEVEVTSGFGTGDCGLGSGFLGAIAHEQPLTLQLSPALEDDGRSFYSDICSYIDMPAKLGR